MMMKRYKTISILTRAFTLRNTLRCYNSKQPSPDATQQQTNQKPVQQQPLSQPNEKQQEIPKSKTFRNGMLLLGLGAVVAGTYYAYKQNLFEKGLNVDELVKKMKNLTSKNEEEKKPTRVYQKRPVPKEEEPVVGKQHIVANVEQEKVQEAPNAVKQPVKDTEMKLRQRSVELQREVDELRARVLELKQREDRLKEEVKKYKEMAETQQVSSERLKELNKEEEVQALLRKELAKQEEALVKKMNKLLEDQEKHFKEELKAQEEMHIKITDELLMEQEKKFEEQYREERLNRLNTLRDLTTKVYALETCFDANADYLTDSLNLQKLVASVFSLQETLRSNGPFKPELDSIAEAGSQDPFITTLLKSVPEQVALSGVLPQHELKKWFSKIYREVLQASYAPDNTGLAGYIFSKIVGLFIIPEKGLVNGDTVDARLARAKFLLEADRLAEAYQEVEAIDGLAGKVIEPWRGQVRKRLIADQALTGIKAHVINLLNAIQRN